MTKLLSTVAVVALCLTGTAHATNWTVYNAGENRCDNAAALAQHGSPMLASPDALIKTARAINGPPQVNIMRDDDGHPEAVAVTARIDGDDITISFFATPELCSSFRENLISDGAVAANKDELK